MIIAVFLGNVSCDQITKTAARNSIEYGERIQVISEGFLTLTKVENTGAFLSLGQHLPSLIKIPLLMITPSLVLIGIFVSILRRQNVYANYALPVAFIIGGGIGNLFDRIMYGSVTDFLHMNFHIFQTGVFNMADVSIMLGTFWLFITQFKHQKNIQTEL